ncbi:MAG: hypothetical protein MUE60_00075 [Candidatus Eisenbacteria bacterium]|jgi:hypothetical protein|nr:hypothetical protein [Candidatus Eisenbacteria bacterium]
MRRLLILLVAGCSIPSPKAPTWDVTANVPLVSRTAFVRELVGAEGDFFFGEYGPFRLMDSDSVVASVVSDVIVADPATLQGLPTQGEAVIPGGTATWSGNPLDELENPSFYRAWLEIVVRHNLPGTVEIETAIEGWDDDGRPSGPLRVSVNAPSSLSGEEIVSTHLVTDPQILIFINPSPTHAVPDSYAATSTLAYTAQGRPVGPQATLSVQVSLLTAFDLTFDGADVDRRSIVQKLVIDPADGDSDDADVEGDLTENLRAALIIADVDNNLPLGGHACVRVDNDSLRLWDDPELLIGPFAFEAPSVDPITGKSTGVAHAQTSVSLDEDQLGLFANPGPGNDTLYAAVEYLLDGSGTRRICICADDSISARILMGITSRIELDDDM